MLISLLLVVAHILGFVSSLHAIMSTRTSQGAVGWVVSLNTFPLIALPAYWVLGRNNFHGYVVERQQENQAVQEALASFRETHPALFATHAEAVPAARAAERLAWMPILRGNRVDLLVDGTATFDSILSGIAEAKSYVLVQFYIVRDDTLGRKLKDALIERAQAGIRVYFLYDEIGSLGLDASYLADLRAAGVEARNFHSRKGPKNRFQINFRNHRKIVVRDGRVGWVGGHNVGDEYMDGGAEFASWRDTHLRIEGPAVLPLQWVFLEDWNWAADELISLSWEPVDVPGAEQDVLILPSGPADNRETATLMFTHAINSATDRIWIASPYFVPDAGVINALQLAMLRGVDVRVLIPDEPDHLLVYLAAFNYLKQVGPDLKIWRYNDGFMHQKVVLIDDKVSCVGTANFDNRSFRLNFEITAMVIDADFNKQVEQMLLHDFARSQPMDPDELSRRSWWFQLKSRAASLFSPIL